MDKKQQIEEMAKDLHSTHAVSSICSGKDCNHCKHANLKRFDDYTCIDLDLSEALYNAGYRKIDDDCALITKDELKQYKMQAVKEFAERLKTEPRITNSGLEFVALVDIDAELEALLKEYEK